MRENPMNGDMSNLQKLIDQIIADVHVGAKPSEAEINSLKEEWDDIFRLTEYIANGIALEDLKSKFNDHNLHEIKGIKLNQITDEDRINFARQEIMSESLDFDPDFSPEFRMLTIKSSEWLDACLIFSTINYSFSGAEFSFEGIFVSEYAFRQSVRLQGYLLTDEINTIQNTKKALSDQEILALWEH